MEVLEERLESIVVVGLKGRMDSNTARVVEEKLLALIDGGSHQLVVDCAQLGYISSAGLRVLLMAAKRMTQAKGRLALAALNDDIKQVFELTGFSSIFQICGSRDEAINQVNAG